MCGSIADIQSATAEIRRGKKRKKKEERKKERRNHRIKYMSASNMQGGHNKLQKTPHNITFTYKQFISSKHDKNTTQNGK